MEGATCTFCDHEGLRASAVLLLEDELCMYVNSETLEGDLLRGSGVIVPKAHRPAVFDLTPAEVQSTFALLAEARPLLDERYKPDGYNIGWNCYAAGGGAPHAHMHVLLRFADEPKAGQGIRWPLRQRDNRRPDPTASGAGSREFLGYEAHRPGGR
jgi:diadenosine tetraphosphate (Ap4A) HIT family hydrolase